MKNPITLILEVRGWGELQKGLLVVCQGGSLFYRRPRLDAMPESPEADYGKYAKKVWGQIFPKSLLHVVAVLPPKDGEVVVQGKARGLICSFEQGVADINTWEFVERRDFNGKG